MDMYGYSGMLVAKSILGISATEVTNMTDINQASPHGCKNGALTDKFGVLIQALLGVIAFSTLMLKRFREPAGIRRPWRIWFYDTSKQAIGSLFIHFANVFLSTVSTEDPCSLYLMNFLLDVTLGMLVIWLALKLFSRIVEYRQWTLLILGEYGDPPRAAAWLGQCGIYLLIMVLAKGVVILVLLIPGWSDLQMKLLSYITSPQLELVLVMLIVPFVVNTIIFWLVDSLLMRKIKPMKSLDDSCDSSVKKADAHLSVNPDETQVLLSVETDTEEASEGEADPSENGPDPYVQYSGGPLRPSWVEV